MKKLMLTIALALVATFTLPAQADAFFLPKIDLSQLFGRQHKIERIDVDADFNKPENTINITFSDLSDAEIISYSLTYFQKRQYEGVTGSFEVNGKDKIVKEVYLGTCSEGGNCTPHENIKWLILKVEAKYSNDKIETRAYPVR